MDSLKQKHPLWPVMHLVDQRCSSLGSNITSAQRELNSVGKDHIRSAIISNVEYLVWIGVLPKMVAMSVEASFSRNQWVL